MRQLLLFGLILLGACDAAAPNTSLVGTWTLHSIDGKALPQVVYQSPAQGCALNVTAGTATFNKDASYLIHLSYAMGSVCIAELFDAGTYVRNGSALTLKPGLGGPEYAVTASALELRRDFEGHRYAYRH